jgi:peptidoglycan/LPS O-acetylase OafA/YrhL
LTSIRFFAALWVVIFHLHESGVAAGNEFATGRWLQNLIATGYCGVALFFVLSGFILSYNYLTLETHGSRLQQYWVARAARVLPLYLFGLLLDSPAVVAGVLKMGVTPASVAWIVGVLVACILLMQAWIPRVALVWNGPGWSLSAEAFFYAVFPFAIGRIRRRPTRNLWLSLFLLQAAMLVPAVCALAWMPEFSGVPASAAVRGGIGPNFLKFFPLFRLPEFLFGMVLGVLFCRASSISPLRRRSSLIGIGGMSGVVVICALGAGDIPYALLHNGLLLIPFGALILGLAQSDSAFARVLSGKWLETLGCASYALYIIHVPVIHYAQALQGRLHWKTAYPGCEMLALLLLLVVLAVALLSWYEEPARRWIMRNWKTRMLARIPAPLPVPPGTP